MFKFFVTGLIFLLVSFSNASTEVKVRGYAFAPFLDFNEKGEPHGATIEILKELNKIQSKYHFKFYKTSPKRRYNHFEHGELDVIFFEDKAWGWNKYNVTPSSVFAKGGEVYITKKDRTKGQEYFKSFNDKRLIGVLGFHYGFAGFEANENTLRRKFNMILTSNSEAIINLILKERGDVGVITESYLRKKIKEDKTLGHKLLVSKKYDQKYKHTALVGQDSPISSRELNDLLVKLADKGLLQKILKEYGIKF